MNSRTTEALKARFEAMRCLYLALLLAIAVPALGDALTPPEARKIEYLIAAIETLPSAQFIRNGTAYDAKDAAEHLRLKLKLAGARVASADDFIRLCASGSSVSGLPYKIRFADGSEVTSESFLRKKLADFEQPPGQR